MGSFGLKQLCTMLHGQMASFGCMKYLGGSITFELSIEHVFLVWPDSCKCSEVERLNLWRGS